MSYSTVFEPLKSIFCNSEIDENRLRKHFSEKDFNHDKCCSRARPRRLLDPIDVKFNFYVFAFLQPRATFISPIYSSLISFEKNGFNLTSSLRRNNTHKNMQEVFYITSSTSRGIPPSISYFGKHLIQTDINRSCFQRLTIKFAS